MDIYFLLLIVVLGIGSQVFLNKRRERKINMFSAEIVDFKEKLISQADQIVDNIDKVINNLGGIGEIKRKPNRKILSLPPKNESEYLRDLVDSSKLMDKRRLYHTQERLTYYHKETGALWELETQPELIGISRYIRIQDIIKKISEIEKFEVGERDKKKTIQSLELNLRIIKGSSLFQVGKA